MTRLRPDALEELRIGRTPNFPSVRIYVRTYGFVGWTFSIRDQEWPKRPYEAYFRIQTDGRWFYGYDKPADNFPQLVTVFSFNEHAKFVPSSFPLVEHGTVVTITRMSILALMHYYGSPSPETVVGAC